MEEIIKLRISQLENFPAHPFQIRTDAEMTQLVESIKENGILVPAIVRKVSDERYELISGHRRKRACELIGITEMDCIIVDATDDEATILMVESNCQRAKVYPSEKAFAYKMHIDALKCQGKRTDLTSSPVETKLKRARTAETIGGIFGDSKEQVYRYIRLTELIPQLLTYVDEGKMKMRPAVEISYIDEEKQKILVTAMEENIATPSHAQSIRMRKLFEEGKLDEEEIRNIMREEKSNQKEKVILRGEEIRKLLPKGLMPAEAEAYICKALQYYNNHLRTKKERDER